MGKPSIGGGHVTKLSVLVGLALIGTGQHNPAHAQSVELNGQPLMTTVAPVSIGGRVLLPMRDIFEALGATVQWNRLTQGLTASLGTTSVRMQIGRHMALVNERNVPLDRPAMLWRGHTMVPLRFVSEALGAQVSWDRNRRLARINTGAQGRAVAGRRTISVPAGTVVPVVLDEAISSASAQMGEIVTATVRSENAGDSEFPAGSKIEGTVTGVQPKAGDNPGIIDLEFRAVVLPDGSRYPLNGELIGLDDRSVTTTANGRIMAQSKVSRSPGEKLKFIGLGAGIGYALGRVLKQKGLVTAVLGAAGGYLYSRSSKKGQAAEAVVPSRTVFGVRLNNRVTYADTTGYTEARTGFLAR